MNIQPIIDTLNFWNGIIDGLLALLSPTASWWTWLLGLIGLAQ